MNAQLQNKQIQDPELIKKYGGVKSLAEKEFPSDEYFIDVVLWTDGDFQISAVHNRVVPGRSRWSCKIRISNEDARNPSEPYRQVTHQKLPREKEYTVWSEQ
jgi:hypothetical protein